LDYGQVEIFSSAGPGESCLIRPIITDNTEQIGHITSFCAFLNDDNIGFVAMMRCNCFHDGNLKAIRINNNLYKSRIERIVNNYNVRTRKHQNKNKINLK